jgi:tetratricopeptide (TPR) repeat protein
VIGEAVIEAARELLGARNYSSVVAVATSALESCPGDIEMRLLRARALLALRRDEEAQTDLRDCLRRQTRCADAYRLLGELCFRRDEFESAAVFLREAIRLRPTDEHSRDLLIVVEGLENKRFMKPTAAVEKLPAATVAVGSLNSDEPRMAVKRPPRLAQGTCAPDVDEDVDLSAPTEVDVWPVSPDQREAELELTDTETADSVTLADPPDPRAHLALEVGPLLGDDGPPTVPERPRATRRHARTPLGSEFEGTPETIEDKLAAGFGNYLLRIGALDRGQLTRARLYQQRACLSLAEAVIALGFASEPTVVTANLAFQAERGGVG